MILVLRYLWLGTVPQADCWHSTAVPQPWAWPLSATLLATWMGEGAGNGLPVEMRETTLPSRETVWSYLEVLSLYLSGTSRQSVVSAGGRLILTVESHALPWIRSNIIAHLLRILQRTRDNTPLATRLRTSRTNDNQNQTPFSGSCQSIILTSHQRRKSPTPGLNRLHWFPYPATEPDSRSGESWSPAGQA